MSHAGSDGDSPSHHRVYPRRTLFHGHMSSPVGSKHVWVPFGKELWLCSYFPKVVHVLQHCEKWNEISLIILSNLLFSHLAKLQLKCLSHHARGGGGSYGLEVCTICWEIADLWKCHLKSFKGNYELKTSVANGLSRKKKKNKTKKSLRSVKMTQSSGWKEVYTMMWYVGPPARVCEPCLNTSSVELENS